jgi:hypothetical protein
MEGSVGWKERRTGSRLKERKVGHRGCRTDGERGMEEDAGLKEREEWKGMKEGRRGGLEEDEGWRKSKSRIGRG